MPTAFEEDIIAKFWVRRLKDEEGKKREVARSASRKNEELKRGGQRRHHFYMS